MREAGYRHQMTNLSSQWSKCHGYPSFRWPSTKRRTREGRPALPNYVCDILTRSMLIGHEQALLRARRGARSHGIHVAWHQV